MGSDLTYITFRGSHLVIHFTVLLGLNPYLELDLVNTVGELRNPNVWLVYKTCFCELIALK